MEFATTFAALVQTGAMLCMFTSRRRTRERNDRLILALQRWIAKDGGR